MSNYLSIWTYKLEQTCIIISFIVHNLLFTYVCRDYFKIVDLLTREISSAFDHLNNFLQKLNKN